MTKTIKIFLASSIVELKNERMELENFIYTVGMEFMRKYNVMLQPLLCENFDDALTRARKQDEYNRSIRESEYCFFIFFTKVGDYTKEEFDVAYEQFLKSGKPKIYTYFKNVDEGNAEQSIRDFMQKLDRELGHYYGTFSDLDTIKLRILLSLKLDEMDFLEIKAEGSSCVVDGKPMMSLKHVSEFANNKSLNGLYAELSEAEEEYYALKPEYEKGCCSQELYHKYSQIASKRQSLRDEIEDLEGKIFNLSLAMTKDSVRGELTARQKQAYHLFEKGDYEGCLSVLNADDIDADYFRIREKLHEQELAAATKYIREHKTAIDILGAMKGYAERFSEIYERYRKIFPVILEMKIEAETALGYIDFLLDQNMDTEALSAAKKLSVRYDDVEREKAHVLDSLGTIHERLNHAVEAEDCYRKAIDIFKALADKEPELYNNDLASSYNNAGLFYKSHGHPEDAEKYYLKAIDISEALARENPERYNADLAACYNNAGILYRSLGCPEDAEKYYLKSNELFEALAHEDPERYNYALAASYNNAGVFYKTQKRPKDAENYYLKSIKIYEAIAPENPERYNADLAACYNNTGIFYYNQRDWKNAEKYYMKAVKIYEALAHEHPERYNASLATIYNCVGLFYAERNRPKEAAKYYPEAIKLREALALENPERHNADLATLYFNYAVFSKDRNYLDKALKLALTRPDHPMCRQIVAALS